YRETHSDMLMPLGFLVAITLFFGLWFAVMQQSEDNWVATQQALRPDIMVQRIALACLVLVVTATVTLAANWTQIPGYYSYVDMASVRQDRYPKNFNRAPEYVVAWMRIGDQTGAYAHLEVAFDCKERYGVAQQIVADESKEANIHSFNNTDAFESAHAETKTIMPDSQYE